MLIHASCVSFNGKGVLLAGAPRTGKSDLALRLIDAGGRLVADDQVMLRREGGHLAALPPPNLAGLLEIRHIGIVQMGHMPEVPVELYIDVVALDAPLERMPKPELIFLLDYGIRRLRLPAFAASTPAKIAAALTYTCIHD